MATNFASLIRPIVRMMQGADIARTRVHTRDNSSTVSTPLKEAQSGNQSHGEQAMQKFPPHIATSAALAHAQARLGADIAGVWLSTASIDYALFDHFSGLWVAPGSPYKDLDKTLWAIRHA